MKIRVLPDTVINQIAAGEVVERPASVVRELVDNALDAGATEVVVNLQSGGVSSIVVRDDGCGMTRDDALLAFDRHATSKIRSAEDLWCIGTLGFRGEALASIAAVSKVRLRTRESSLQAGCEVVIEGGKLLSSGPCAWGAGTEIEVRKLFFNVPARKKFLRSERAEVARIKTWLAGTALAHPAVRFVLTADGEEILNLARVTDPCVRARSLFQGSLLTIPPVSGEVSVCGVVGHPSLAVADASGLYILVNGRLVTDRIVSRAVREGFDSMLKDREYPVGFVDVRVDPGTVDVNVHPQKSEVRFRSNEAVFSAVRDGVYNAVVQFRAPVTDARRESTGRPPHNSAFASFPAAKPSEPMTWSSADAHGNAAALAYERYREPLAFSAANSFVAERHSEAVEAFAFSDLRYIGQVLQCYLLCERGESLVVVDMHAAHERVNYNRIRRAFRNKDVTTQRLLIPIQVALTDEQAAAIAELAPHLAVVGLEVVASRGAVVSIVGVPASIAHLDVTNLVKDIATDPLPMAAEERIDTFVDHVAARLACHASVRSGDIIGRDEVYALFKDLDDTELSTACPHGRPIVVSHSKMAIERWFGRDR